MLPNNLLVSKDGVKASYVFFLLATMILYLWPAYSQAADTVSAGGADDMLTRIATELPALTYMVTAISYVLGMYFMVYGVIQLKEYGEARTMMSQQHSLKGPLIFITVGAFLLYLPTAISVGLSTFWAEPNPYAYVSKDDTQWSNFWNVCYLIVQFIGGIAFIRGLVILSHLGGLGGQPGTFGRGMTHIIGGIFCINIYQFVQVIFKTLGITT